MVWHRPGNKPLSEPMIFSLLMHICVTRPQSVNTQSIVIHSLTGQNQESRRNMEKGTSNVAGAFPAERNKMQSFDGFCVVSLANPDSNVHGANMGLTGSRWAPCWPHESGKLRKQSRCQWYEKPYRLGYVKSYSDGISCDNRPHIEQMSYIPTGKPAKLAMLVYSLWKHLLDTNFLAENLPLTHSSLG